MEKGGIREVEKERECIIMRWEAVQGFPSHSLSSLRKFLRHARGIVDGKEEEMKGKRRKGTKVREYAVEI